MASKQQLEVVQAAAAATVNVEIETTIINEGATKTKNFEQEKQLLLTMIMHLSSQRKFSSLSQKRKGGDRKKRIDCFAEKKREKGKVREGEILKAYEDQYTVTTFHDAPW